MSAPIMTLPSVSTQLKYLIPGTAEAFMKAANESGNSAAVEIAKKILQARGKIYIGVFGQGFAVVTLIISYLYIKIKADNPKDKKYKMMMGIAWATIVIAAITLFKGTFRFLSGVSELSSNLIKLENLQK